MPPQASLGSLYVHLRANATQYNAVMNGVVVKMNKTAVAMAAAGRKMSMMVTAPLLIIGALSVKSFTKFGEQLANVSTMLDDQTMNYLPAYAKALKKLAVEFGEGTETLSKGLYDILSASVAPAKALDVLTTSVKAAKAGMTDTGVAADAITTVLNSYGMAAEEAGKVSDILFATVKRGKTTFAQLAPAIGMVASIASTAGLSFEEVGAALATMTRAGLRTRIAVTALRATVNSFIKPTDDAIEAVKAFGFALNSTTLSTIGLTGVMQKLRDASAEQLASIFPNIRALAGIAAMARQADKQMSDLKLMFNATGLTQKAYNKMTGTLIHSLRQMWQAIKVAAMTIGSTLEPYIKRASDAVSWFAKTWTTLRVEVRKNIIGYAALAATIGPVALAMSGLLKLMGLMVTAVWGLTGGFAAWMLSLNPILLAVVLLAGAAYAFRAAWIQGLETVHNLWRDLLTAWEIGVDWLRNKAIGPFLRWFANSWTTVLADAKTKTKQFVSDFISSLMGAISWWKVMWKAVKDAGEYTVADLDKAWERAKQGWTDAGQAFALTFVAAEEMISKKATQIEDKFQAAMAAIVKEVKVGAAGLSDFVESSAANLERLWEMVKLQAGEDIRSLVNLMKSEIAKLQNIPGVKIEGLEQLKSDLESLAKAATDAQQIIAKVDMASRKAVQDRLDALQMEIELMGYLNEERERAQGLMEFRNLLDKAYNDDLATKNQLLGEYIGKMQTLAQGTTGIEAFKKEIQLAGMEAINLAKNLGEIVVSAVDRLSRAFADMAMGGKVDFRELARSVIGDLMQMIFKALMYRAIMSMFGIPAVPDFSGLMTGFGGGGPGSAGLAVGSFHKGGVIGKTAPATMTLPASMFTNAVRLHKGLRSNEFPAVLERGEQVVPKGGGDERQEPVSVNITNNITAMDTQDVSRALSPLSRQMARQVQGAMRKNHPIRRSG